MTSLLFLFFLCFLLSAFFAGSEMAFVSTSRIRLREWADQGNRAAALVLKLHEKNDQFLATVLVGNNIANIGATVSFTLILRQWLGIESEWLVTLLLGPALIIFAELLPKDYCRLRSSDVLLRHAVTLTFLSKIFFYPAGLILKCVDFFLKPLGPLRPNIFVDEEEFRSLIEESARTGVVTGPEKQLIDTILDFEKVHIESVMTPVQSVAKVPITAKVHDVKELARRSGAKMVLVYEEIPQIIVGMIYVFDLLFEENEDEGLKNFLRSPIFLPRQTSLERAFLTLQEKRQSYALVVDAHGNVIGAISVERLLVL